MSKYKTTWHDIAKAILRKEEFITEEQLIEQDKQDIQEFSRSQLDALARQYSDLKGKTISIDNANKLRKIFDKIPNHFLNDLRKNIYLSYQAWHYLVWYKKVYLLEKILII